MKFYKVGGCVRDAILGVQSKDIDFSVEAPSYAAMREEIAKRGRIFKEDEPFFTIRAIINKEAADFVLCRKERDYSDGRRPDSVEIGTLDDDLARRDFTMNAIAQKDDGSYYDPHEGIRDIQLGLIRCVGVAADRFREDSLRMLRAIRFSITKQFSLDAEIRKCLENIELVNLLENVSVERIREELNKALKYDTLQTLNLLSAYPYIQHQIFHQKRLWLESTLKQA